MKRIAVFAFYNKDGIIKNYVIRYLKYLKEISDSIIFIADNELDDRELEKISCLIDYSECHPHGEYDFGSYKRGFNYLKKNHLLEDTDELVFCNDSCFCVDSLSPAFLKMDESDCDFYALTKSNEYEPHLQSFFLVIRKRLLNSKVFDDYLNSVVHLDSFLEIVNKYEIPLKRTFESLGFKSDAFLKMTGKYPVTFYPVRCIKAGMPLIKRKFFLDIYGSRESLLKVALCVRAINKETYKEILEYFEVNSIVKLWYKFALARLKIFLYKKEISRKGTLKIRVLKIPVFIKKVRK
ncbi:MAG: rhamnan synthesis F family protein [Succinivibrio sp.]